MVNVFATSGSRLARVGLAVAALTVAALTGCSDGDDAEVLAESAANPSTTAPTTTAPPTSTTTADATSTTSTTGAVGPAGAAHEPSRLPCQLYRSILESTANGTLNDAQARQRGRQMHDAAADATPAVKEAVADLMTALNESDPDAYLASAQTVGRACAAAGH